MEWDEKEPRWDELRSSASVKCKCEVWRVQCEVWGVKGAVWSVECEESSEKWEVWSVDCEVWSVECEVRSLKSAVWSEVWSAKSAVKREVWSVKREVWSVKSAVRNVKCEVEIQMWHVKQDTSFAECTHARAWLAHGACKFYRWERSYIYIYIFKATSAPPRAGTTGIKYIIDKKTTLIWQMTKKSRSAKVTLSTRAWKYMKHDETECDGSCLGNYGSLPSTQIKKNSLNIEKQATISICWGGHVPFQVGVQLTIEYAWLKLFPVSPGFLRVISHRRSFHA